MSSDETYLEAFIDKVSTLPHQLRRNLDLLRDLDTSNGTDLATLRQLQRQYLRAAEDKVLQLQIVEMDETDDANNETNASDYMTDRRFGSVLGIAPRPPYTVRVAPPDGTGPISFPLSIPSTQEFMDYIHSDPNARMSHQEIGRLSHACLQKADEKVAVAQQTYELLDAHVQRLDADLAAMEQLLQSTGEFHQGTTVKPNDLAACQVTPGSEWILAKVIQHDPVSRVYKLADEDVESNKVFDVPEQQVVVLGGLERLSKGDVVFAVYPDTTSFYQATVVQAPRKQGSSMNGQFLMVNFVDDADEFGITHDKAVPMQHIMMPPSSG